MNKKTEEINDEQKKKNEEVARTQWDSWLGELEDGEQPKACSIDNDDCEACGS
tara:strand:+ start:2788 stop:2946 length:159 start_codon:yes stop_codon:yes gene_type:complete